MGFLKSLIISFFFILCFAACQQKQKKYESWTAYNGGTENLKYSSLTQIDTNNVSSLQQVWAFATGDADTVNKSQIQCNPIMVDGVLYGTSPQMKLFAIDARTGNQKWMFNPFDTPDSNKVAFFILNNSRGIAYWTDGSEDKRIYYTAGAFLYAINANTGKPVAAFGNGGKLDLHDGLGRDVKDLFMTATTPGVVYKDLLIMGSRVDEGAAAAPGHIRAFDVRTGKQQWIFHTIPYPGEEGYESWEDTAAYKHIGGANCWSGFSLDTERGIVYAPTGSASWDFYGGKRLGANLFADCLLALDAATGKKKWHFQQIHHDVWDRDLPAPPVLVTIMHKGKKRDVVAQTTKTGFVYVLDRETGESIYPIKEMPVPDSTELVGEKIFPTQPVPEWPKPFVRQTFHEEDINDLVSPAEQEDIRKKLLSYKRGHMFEPPSLQGTLIFPGYDGGSEWGGPAVDAQTGVLYVNANEMPWVLTMVPLKNKAATTTETYLTAGKRLYRQHCMTCHGPERKGGGNYPSIVNASLKYNEGSFHKLINTGRRMMPAFKQLSDEDKKAVATYVLNLKDKEQQQYTGAKAAVNPYLDMPYTTTGYNKFVTEEGYPAVKPPWGTLNAIDLNTGNLLWKAPLGEHEALKKRGVPPTGTENYGGPVVTAGGLLFIGATSDGKLRAFNKRTGKLLWEAALPASAFATPSIYNLDGKQYLVIACGGGKLKTKSGDQYVAYALPDVKQ